MLAYVAPFSVEWRGLAGGFSARAGGFSKWGKILGTLRVGLSACLCVGKQITAAIFKSFGAII